MVNEDEQGPTIEYKAADGSIKTMTQVRSVGERRRNLATFGNERHSSTTCAFLDSTRDHSASPHPYPHPVLSGPSHPSTPQAELQQRLQQQEAVLPQLNQDGSGLSKSEEGKATIEEVRGGEGWEEA